MSQVAPYKFYRRRIFRLSYWRGNSAYGFWPWFIWRVTHYRMRNGYFRCIAPDWYSQFPKRWRW